MDPESISNALTSGLLAPSIGGALVVAAWLASKIKYGNPIGAQLKASLLSAVPALIPAFAAAGVSLMAELPPVVAVANGLTVLLTLTNFRSPAPPSGGDKPKKASKLASSLLLGVAVMFCVLPGCSKLLPYIVKAGQLAQFVAGAVDKAERLIKTWFAAHPDAELEIKITEAIAKTRGALAALDEATLAAKAQSDGHTEAAKEHVVAAYTELYRLVEGTGALSGGALGASPGASGGELPTPADISAHLE